MVVWCYLRVTVVAVGALAPEVTIVTSTQQTDGLYAVRTIKHNLLHHHLSGRQHLQEEDPIRISSVGYEVQLLWHTLQFFSFN